MARSALPAVPLAAAAALLLLVAGAAALDPALGTESRSGASLEAAQRIQDLPGCGGDGSLQPVTDGCSLSLTLPGGGAARWCGRCRCAGRIS